jgi:hypothetical protein
MISMWIREADGSTRSTMLNGSELKESILLELAREEMKKVMLVARMSLDRKIKALVNERKVFNVRPS